MSWLGQVIGGVVGAIGTHRQNQWNRSLTREMRDTSVTRAMQQCIAYGLHPSVCAGQQTSSGPTVAMQNPMGQLSQALQGIRVNEDSTIDRQLKEYALREAKNRESDRKWEYSLLIPVDHPHLKDQKIWAFNSKYQMYGITAQSLVIAANSKDAWRLIMAGATEQEKRAIKQAKKKAHNDKMRAGFKEYKKKYPKTYEGFKQMPSRKYK